MYTSLLSAHILIASIMTIATLGVFMAAHAKRKTKAYLMMIVSFSLTTLSGIGLLFVTTAGLGRFCAMMSLFTVSVVVARSYYRKQTLSTAS